MTKLFFHINGSGSPFWKTEGTDINGGKYYSDLFWPHTPLDELKVNWKEIQTLFNLHPNPIDSRFPSFWDNSAVQLFNLKVSEFINYSSTVLTEYEIVNRHLPIEVDSKLLEYKSDPIKYHLDLNRTFNSRNDLISYLNSKPEKNSLLTSEITYYKKFDITQDEYDSFNRIFLTFDNYTNFPISFCPFSNRPFLTIINIGGHRANYELMRIKRSDILNDPDKIIKYIDNYLRE